MTESCPAANGLEPQNPGPVFPPPSARGAPRWAIWDQHARTAGVCDPPPSKSPLCFPVGATCKTAGSVAREQSQGLSSAIAPEAILHLITLFCTLLRGDHGAPWVRNGDPSGEEQVFAAVLTSSRQIPDINQPSSRHPPQTFPQASPRLRKKALAFSSCPAHWHLGFFLGKTPFSPFLPI